MSRRVGTSDRAPRDQRTSMSGNDPDLSLAMDLAYNLNRRKQKTSSPFYHSSSKSLKSRNSERKDGASTPMKTRARKIKAHETEPFLSVDTLPDERKPNTPDGLSRNGNMSRGRVTPMSMGIRQMSRFSMYSTPSVPTRTSLTRGSMNRRQAASSMSQKLLANQSKVRTPNQHIKMPFKHSVHQHPVTPAPPERPASPSRDLKERTALATFHVNKVLSLEKQTSHHKAKGKLLKAKLKPLYPVQVKGPSIHNCRGIVADAHQYSASPSRSLQRRKQILSSMNSGELKDLMDRPRTVESIHRTSIASSVDENRDFLVEDQPVEWSPETISSHASTPNMRPTSTLTDQDLNDILEPNDFASASPIISREASKDSLGESTRDTSTVFLTSGQNVEQAENEIISDEKVVPELEDASREIIEMTEMLKHRISLIGIETGDLIEAEMREVDVRTEESSETESRSGVKNCETESRSDLKSSEGESRSGLKSSETESRSCLKNSEAEDGKTTEAIKSDSKGDENSEREEETDDSFRIKEKESIKIECEEDKQVGLITPSDGRVRPFSATTQLSQPLSSARHEKRPLSTGDETKRSVVRSKSVRFADEADTVTSQAWKEKDDEQKSQDNSNNNCPGEGGSNPRAPSKVRCKPNENEVDTNSQDPDDDKENHSPKKMPYFSSSSTFSQALQRSSDSTMTSSGVFKSGPKDESEPSTGTSFMEEFLAHAAPVDDSVCSASSEELLKEDTEDKEKPVNPFPLMSLSERIAGNHITARIPTAEVDEAEETPQVSKDLSEEPVEADPAVNLTISSHDMISEFEETFGPVQACKGKPPSGKSKRKKSKSKPSSKRPESPQREGRPLSPVARPTSPNRNSKRERPSSGKSSKSSSHSSKYSYGVDGRHHFPSDLIDIGETPGKSKPKTKKAWSRPGSGNSLSSNSSRNSRRKTEVPGLNFEEDLEGAVDYDDLDHQINLIQSELKRNIDQQAQLLEDTETLRQTLRSREGFYTDQDEEKVDLPSDGYYHDLLLKYREKCLEMGPSCLMISDHITTPRWQQGRGQTDEHRGDILEEPESSQDILRDQKQVSEQDSQKCDGHAEGPSDKVEGQADLQTPQGLPERHLISQEQTIPDNDFGEQSSYRNPANSPQRTPTGGDAVEMVEMPDPDETKIDRQSFLRLLCTTIEEVDQPCEPEERVVIRPHLTPLEKLKVVATKKELSKEKLRHTGKPTAPFPPLCFTVNARPPSGSVYYFAYSDLMNVDRMNLFLKREVKGRFWGLLMGFNLVFNKKGEDIEAGGFANIEFNPFCSVEGCVYQIEEQELNVLDKCVGVPQHYCRAVLPVWMSNSTDPDQHGVAQYCIPAVVYIAQDHWLHTDPSNPLSSEYSASQCQKSADILTPAYRSHLNKFTQPTQQVQAASA